MISERSIIYKQSAYTDIVNRGRYLSGSRQAVQASSSRSKLYPIPYTLCCSIDSSKQCSNRQIKSNGASRNVLIANKYLPSGELEQTHLEPLHNIVHFV
jgi:hypothetical protein